MKVIRSTASLPRNCETCRYAASHEKNGLLAQFSTI